MRHEVKPTAKQCQQAKEADRGPLSSSRTTQAQVWGEELDDPFLGPRIALAAEDAMKSIQVSGPKGRAAPI